MLKLFVCTTRLACTYHATLLLAYRITICSLTIVVLGIEHQNQFPVSFYQLFINRNQLSNCTQLNCFHTSLSKTKYLPALEGHKNVPTESSLPFSIRGKLKFNDFKINSITRHLFNNVLKWKNLPCAVAAAEKNAINHSDAGVMYNKIQLNDDEDADLQRIESRSGRKLVTSHQETNCGKVPFPRSH